MLDGRLLIHLQLRRIGVSNMDWFITFKLSDVGLLGAEVVAVVARLLQPMVEHDFAMNFSGTKPALGIVSVAMALPLLSAVRRNMLRS